jgi:tetratricopeptide (TPR) repeat protein
VARCDQKIAHCLVEIGDGDAALAAAQKSLDVFVTAHDHRRETYSLLELGKAQILIGQADLGLLTLERVLEDATDSDPRDFEFILEVERRMASALRALDREEDALEIERRLLAVSEIIEDQWVEPSLFDER